MVTNLSVDEPRKRLFVARIPIRWRDMDVNRHVNNTVYFRYFEQTRIEWCDSVRAPWTQSAQSFVIAAAHCNYRKPLAHPGTVEVILYAGAIGRSSFTLHYDLFLEGDRTSKHADGYTRQVWIDRGAGTSAALPDFMRALLS